MQIVNWLQAGTHLYDSSSCFSTILGFRPISWFCIGCNTEMGFSGALSVPAN